MTAAELRTIRTVLDAGGIKQLAMRMGRTRKGVVRAATANRLYKSGHLEFTRDFNGFMIYVTAKGCRAVYEARA
jgi:hypothetical protein